MPPLRERIAEWLDNGATRQRLVETEQQIEQLRETLSSVISAYSESSAWTDPRQLVDTLRETGVDEAVLLDLVYNMGWDRIATLGTSSEVYGRERTIAVQQSERMWKYSPQAQWAVWLWTGWGLGDSPHIQLKDSASQEWWDEFVSARRNAILFDGDKIYEMLSDWLLVKGNRFLSFYAATDDGQATVRVVAQEEIAEILTNPDDASEPWFYKRQYQSGNDPKTLYYADWETFFGGELDARWKRLIETRKVEANAVRADLVKAQGIGIPGTAVCMLHIAHNCKEESSLWGWPLSTTAGSWLRALKSFMEARLGVAMAKSQFVRRTTVDSGSRGIAAIRGIYNSALSQSQMYDTNPPAPAGSTDIQNQKLKTEELPMSTGASDAKNDWEMFGHQSLLGVGLFPTSAGMDTSRWATAVEMDKAQSMLFERYKSFWSAQFRKLVRVVLLFANQYGGQSFDVEQPAEVSTDNFSLSDFPSVTTAIGAAVQSVLTPLVTNDVIPLEAAKQIAAQLWRVVLQALGVTTAADLTSDEAFEMGDYAPEEPEVPETPAVVPPTPGVQPGQVQPGQAQPETPTPPVAAEAIAQAIANYRSGAIDADTLAEFSVMELLAHAGENGHGHTHEH